MSVCFCLLSFFFCSYAFLQCHLLDRLRGFSELFLHRPSADIFFRHRRRVQVQAVSHIELSFQWWSITIVWIANNYDRDHKVGSLLNDPTLKYEQHFDRSQAVSHFWVAFETGVASEELFWSNGNAVGCGLDFWPSALNWTFFIALLEISITIFELLTPFSES